MARTLRGLRRPPEAGGPGLTSGHFAGRFHDADRGDELTASDLAAAADATGPVPVEPGLNVRPGTIRQGDRLKAYRPIPPDRRREALEAGLEAYASGNFYEAHELLEPAWMGTSDMAERALYQGLIKLAAGYVHAVRGNPVGMTRNLEGARRLLATCLELDPSWGPRSGIDVEGLVGEVDVRLASVRSAVAKLNANPATMLDLADAAPRIR